jgi:hypothetical protein
MQTCSNCLGASLMPALYWSSVAWDKHQQVAVPAMECLRCGALAPIPEELLAMAADLPEEVVRRRIWTAERERSQVEAVARARELARLHLERSRLDLKRRFTDELATPGPQGEPVKRVTMTPTRRHISSMSSPPH